MYIYANIMYIDMYPGRESKEASPQMARAVDEEGASQRLCWEVCGNKGDVTEQNEMFIKTVSTASS